MLMLMAMPRTASDRMMASGPVLCVLYLHIGLHTVVMLMQSGNVCSHGTVKVTSQHIAVSVCVII